MLETFLHPGFLAGAALVSSPIIIHLINRMRFKRLRWAAMEFLLKSQKRNRRRLLIEQLILLALRCLLVILAVLLAARYLFSFELFQNQGTVHVVLIDDTLSMSDHWPDKNEKDGQADTFLSARRVAVEDIARNALRAGAAQRLAVVYLSRPDAIVFNERLNEQALRELEETLQGAACTALHVDLIQGLGNVAGDRPGAVAALLQEHAQEKRFLHVVSDFRQRDWNEPVSSRLVELLKLLGGQGVKINLIDAANPPRRDNLEDARANVPAYHENLSIVDLRPESRIAAQNTPVQVSVSVANFGISERKNVRVTFKVNGGQRLESETFPTLGPGEVRDRKFMMTFDKAGFHQISASLEKEETGLEADNTRFAVIRIVERVPLLLIDGEPASAREPGGDSYQVQMVFNKDVLKGYEIQRGVVKDLERSDLDQYASIYLLNIRDFSTEALAGLENYVRDGGSVAFFLGEKVDPIHYTDKLYRKGTGFFPAPLDRPVQPSEDAQERNAWREKRLNDGQPKVYLRDGKHQILAEVFQAEQLRFLLQVGLLIEGYFPVPRVSWPPRPGPVAGPVAELVSLPNARSVRDYEGQARQVLRELVEEESRFPGARDRLKRHREAIEDSLNDKPLHELARALEELLGDAGAAGEPDRPNLVELWKQPEVRGLRDRIDKFRETVQYGDPLVVARSFGKGKVVAFLTTAGQKWNNWSGSELVSGAYLMMLGELQKFLTSVGEEARFVGEPLKLERDGSRYDNTLRSRYFAESNREGGPARLLPADGAEADRNLDAPRELFGSLSKEDMDVERLAFAFDEARKPGVYLFDLTRRAPRNATEARPRAERLAVVFNVDTVAESDLQRASRTKLEEVVQGLPPGRVQLLGVGSERFKELGQRQTDLSESPWFFLLFLLILVAEQAMAVRLSYHLRGQESSLPVARARPRTTAA